MPHSSQNQARVGQPSGKKSPVGRTVSRSQVMQAVNNRLSLPPGTVMLACARASVVLQLEIAELASTGRVTLPVRALPCLLDGSRLITRRRAGASRSRAHSVLMLLPSTHYIVALSCCYANRWSASRICHKALAPGLKVGVLVSRHSSLDGQHWTGPRKPH